MTNQVKAGLMIANHPTIKEKILPFINVERETIYFDKVEYGSLSGGEKVLFSWLWVLWTDTPVPMGWRDPVADFGVLDAKTQVLVVDALLSRHNGTHLRDQIIYS